MCVDDIGLYQYSQVLITAVVVFWWVERCNSGVCFYLFRTCSSWNVHTTTVNSV